MESDACSYLARSWVVEGAFSHRFCALSFTTHNAAQVSLARRASALPALSARASTSGEIDGALDRGRGSGVVACSSREREASANACAAKDGVAGGAVVVQRGGGAAGVAAQRLAYGEAARGSSCGRSGSSSSGVGICNSIDSWQRR